MSNIAIFGATGMTGLCALKAAVEKGLTVRAFVRDPAKVPDNLRSRVEIVVGNVLNDADVLKAVEGMDAVAVVLGTNNDLKATTDLSVGMQNIVNAMKHHNVPVVSVCLSAFLFYDVDKVPPVFKELNADHQREFDIAKASGLKYICVLPPHIADQPKSGYIIEFDKSPGRVVSKYDLGEFLIDSLSKPEYYEKVCGIMSKN